MNFHLPEEYKDFVTNADELLREFSSKNENDNIVFRIYLEIDDNKDGFQSITSFYDSIFKFIQTATKQYVWHQESIYLRISLPLQSTSIDEVFIEGSCAVGNNIEDEWFITSILIRLSLEYPSLCIYLFDSDDQFLLIEAADEIPEWLNPDNSTNRTWLKNGKFFIIDLSFGGLDKSGKLKLNYALSIIRSESEKGEKSDLYHPKFQEAIVRRTIDVYPLKIRAIQHKSIFILPRKMAVMFHRHPELLSPCLNAFIQHSTDHKMVKKLSKRKYMETHLNDYVGIDLLYTKALHAQLSFNTGFHPPKLFHSLISTVSTASNASSHIKKSMDLGIRLMYGLEILYELSKSEQKDHSSNKDNNNDSSEHINTSKKELKRILSRLTNSLELTTETMDKMVIASNEDKIPSNTSIDTTNNNDNDNNGVSEYHYTIVNSKQPWKKVLACDFIDQYLHQGNTNEEEEEEEEEEDMSGKVIELQELYVNSVEIYREKEDSLDWLSMTPEEFERDMNRKIESLRYNIPYHSESQMRDNSKDSSSRENSNPSSNMKSSVPDVNKVKSVEDMQAIVDGVKTFFKSSSEFDGVSNDIKRNKKATSDTSHMIISNSNEIENVAKNDGFTKVDEIKSLEGINFEIIEQLIKAASTITPDYSGIMNKLSDDAKIKSTSATNLSEYFDDESSHSESEDADDADDADDSFVSEQDCNQESLNMNANNDSQLKSNIFETISDSSTKMRDDENELISGIAKFRISDANNSDDATKMGAILNKSIAKSEENQSESSWDSDDENYEDARRIKEDKSPSLYDEISDGEVDGFMIEYMNALESELSGTTLGTTFEMFGKNKNGEDNNNTKSDNKDYDIDKNLLKCLLQSHVSSLEQNQQKGQSILPGPASILLSQLGIQLPSPPTMTRKPQ